MACWIRARASYSNVNRQSFSARSARLDPDCRNVLPAPDWPLPIAAGYVYGFWAFPLTYASVAFASVLAFLAARYLLRDIGLHDSPLEGIGFEPSVPLKAPGVLVVSVLFSRPLFRSRGGVTRYRWFESGSLQRRVNCELDFGPDSAAGRGRI